METMTPDEYEEYLKTISDEELVMIRNRVAWECKRRINDKGKHHAKR